MLSSEPWSLARASSEHLDLLGSENLLLQQKLDQQRLRTVQFGGGGHSLTSPSCSIGPTCRKSRRADLRSPPARLCQAPWPADARPGGDVGIGQFQDLAVVRQQHLVRQHVDDLIRAAGLSRQAALDVGGPLATGLSVTSVSGGIQAAVDHRQPLVAHNTGGVERQAAQWIDRLGRRRPAAFAAAAGGS